MRILDRILGKKKVEEPRLFSARELQAKKLKRVMRTVAARQDEKPTELIKRRHLSGLSFPGASTVPARIPVSLTRGSLRNIDPWWHANPVRRHYRDDELTPDRQVGNTDKYLVGTEIRDIVLLDGRKFKTIRKVYYDKKAKLHSKELFMQDDTGKISDYNKLPVNLLGLDGMESVSIQADKEIVVVEGYPAAESLRKRGIEAVGIIGGTFDVPSERALAPLLKAKHILLWPDNDSAGAFLMSGVAKALNKMGAREGQIKLVIWRKGPRKGDAYDFSGDEDELQSLFDEAVVWSPEIRIATNSIQYLSVPQTLPKLRLDYRVQPPTPELTREKAPSGIESEIAEIIGKYVGDEPLSDEDKSLLESLGLSLPLNGG